MFKLNPILLLVAVLLIASLACALPGVPVSTPDPNTINTSVAGTIMVRLTQSAQPLIPDTGMGTPTFTFTPEPPTFTPTATLSPTPVFTSTPLIPLISVSVPTNCRVGPGKVYDRVGALLVGEVTEVYGRDVTGSYWYVRNPDDPGEFCWLWGEYATLSGNTLVLPIFTPPPTPTPIPAFEADYSGLDSCVGWWVEIRLVNIGTVPFESMSLTVRDTDTDIVLSQDSNKFTNINGCLTTDEKESLTAGAKTIISSPVFAYDPTGHKLRATVTLCTGSSQTGMCVSQVINFTP
ncbi:MAG: hypothetical protein C3F07_08180 [Anaerolineales bacterium]|nr:MAG: hypothetical protein C3F07_08180 [Anaerolineales bacterium]